MSDASSATGSTLTIAPVRGSWPKRWACKLRGHDVSDTEVVLRVKTHSRWEMLHGPTLTVCTRCGHHPGGSVSMPSTYTLDYLAMRPSMFSPEAREGRKWSPKMRGSHE